MQICLTFAQCLCYLKSLFFVKKWSPISIDQIGYLTSLEMEIIKLVTSILLVQIFISNANSEDFVSGEVLKLLEKLALKVETLEKVPILLL